VSFPFFPFGPQFGKLRVSLSERHPESEADEMFVFIVRHDVVANFEAKTCAIAQPVVHTAAEVITIGGPVSRMYFGSMFKSACENLKGYVLKAN